MSLSTSIALIRLCRPKHWLKNVLIFAPLIFSGNLLNPENFFKTLLGWIAFNFTASAVYIFNDLRDIETDKLHEIKKKSPSGRRTGHSDNCKNFVLFADHCRCRN